jgi:hypothetical protein
MEEKKISLMPKLSITPIVLILAFLSDPARAEAMDKEPSLAVVWSFAIVVPSSGYFSAGYGLDCWQSPCRSLCSRSSALYKKSKILRSGPASSKRLAMLIPAVQESRSL